jgi:hypothetical protein
MSLQNESGVVNSHLQVYGDLLMLIHLFDRIVADIILSN